MAVDIREYKSSLAFVGVAVVLWSVALLLGSNLLGFISIFSGGLGVASFIHTRRRLLGSPGHEMIEGRVDELEAQLANAAMEIERLRAKVEFDRQLRSEDQG